MLKTFRHSIYRRPHTPLKQWTRTKMTKLSNGVRIVTEETGSPVVCVALCADAGSRYELPDVNGIFHFIEHMAFKGFHSMNKAELQKVIKERPIKLHSRTTRDIQYFWATCTPDCTPTAIDIIGKIAGDIQASDSDIGKAVQEILAEGEDAEGIPKNVVMDYLHQAAFQGTPLAQRVIGPSYNLERFTSSCLSCYMIKHYVPQRLVLAVSGNVRHKDVEEAAKASALNSLDKTKTGGKGPTETRYTGSQILYRDDSMPYAHYAMALEAPGAQSDDFWTCYVAKHIIGSWDKSQGGGEKHGAPLARAAACTDSCVRVESFYTVYKDVGLWGIYFVCPRIGAEDILYNITNSWMHLCTTCTSKEFERGRNFAKLAYGRRLTGSVNSCLNIGRQILYHDDRKTVAEVFTKLDQMTKETIKDVMYRIIYNQCPVVTGVGPTEELPEYNRIRNLMYWVRI